MSLFKYEPIEISHDQVIGITYKEITEEFDNEIKQFNRLRDLFADQQSLVPNHPIRQQKAEETIIYHISMKSLLLLVKLTPNYDHLFQDDENSDGEDSEPSDDNNDTDMDNHDSDYDYDNNNNNDDNDNNNDNNDNNNDDHGHLSDRSDLIEAGKKFFQNLNHHSNNTSYSHESSQDLEDCTSEHQYDTDSSNNSYINKIHDDYLKQLRLAKEKFSNQKFNNTDQLNTSNRSKGYGLNNNKNKRRKFYNNNNNEKFKSDKNNKAFQIVDQFSESELEIINNRNSLEQQMLDLDLYNDVYKKFRFYKTRRKRTKTNDDKQHRHQFELYYQINRFCVNSRVVFRCRKHLYNQFNNFIFDKLDQIEKYFFKVEYKYDDDKIIFGITYNIKFNDNTKSFTYVQLSILKKGLVTLSFTRNSFYNNDYMVHYF